jgi:Zn-dependent protease with chaperone function
MRRRWLLATFLGALALTGVVWARKPGDPLKPGFNLFSRQQDVQLGQVSAAQVRKQYREVQDPFLQDYIRRLGDRLAATPEARGSDFHFTFTMLNVPQVNAFALPGGPMFIFTGIFKATENEAQLAAVMAHEMSHVILRHGTHEASKAKGVGMLAALAGAVAGNGTAGGQLANLGLGIGANSVLLHFSREAESEADALGSHLMSEAGYNPIEMAHFFEKLASTSDHGPQFLSDHPNPDNRERAIEEEIRTLPQREYGYETGQFLRAKDAVNSLLPGGVAPGPGGSGTSSISVLSWRQARTQNFEVTYPADWVTVGGENTTGVVIAPRNGVAAVGNGALDLAYGVKLSYFHPEERAQTLGTATLSLVAQLHEQDQSIRLAAVSQRATRLNGSEGLVTMLEAQSHSGGPEANVLVSVLRPQGLFYALCIAPKTSYAQYQAVFERILSSIRFQE